MNSRFLLSALLVSLFFVGCGPKKSSNTVKKIGPQDEVTAENYLSGRAFCEKYSGFAGREYGKFIQVPLDYQNPSKGKMEVYAWTNKPFNPKLPSFVYLNGGPGQNGHGGGDFFETPRNAPSFKKYSSAWNQINFDQRGLGCSSPQTFELYKNPRLYSTDNTVRDMEAIRKAFGIQSWSVYGISYGTLPATVYGSKYPLSTKSVVLEGVVNDYKDVHQFSYKAEKINLILSNLSSVQKKNFNLLMEDDRYSGLLLGLVFELLYSDLGFKKFSDFLSAVLPASGQIHYDILDRVKNSLEGQSASPFETPQNPVSIDHQVYQSIFCRELGAFVPVVKWGYDSSSTQLIRLDWEIDSNEQSCLDIGLRSEDQNIYQASQHPVQKPVIYFQGTHDGATHASGAVKHWKVVPQKSSQMLLSTRGGHNPLLEKMILSASDFDEGSSIEKQKLVDKMKVHQEAFSTALKGSAIPQALLEKMNRTLTLETAWLSPTKDTAGFRLIEDKLKNIKKAN